MSQVKKQPIFKKVKTKVILSIENKLCILMRAFGTEMFSSNEKKELLQLIVAIDEQFIISITNSLAC